MAFCYDVFVASESNSKNMIKVFDFLTKDRTNKHLLYLPFDFQCEKKNKRDHEMAEISHHTYERNRAPK